MPDHSLKRAILIVLDSVGIGAAPDAADYDDVGANTLLHTAEAVGGLNLPCLGKMGLGNIPSLLTPGLRIPGTPPCDNPSAGFGAMRELSRGKDTTTGHWEIAGIELNEGFRLFPKEYPSFPVELIRDFELRTGRKVIGNRAAGGTAIIDELGARQMETGAWIVYTSADSVLQIAAHEEIIPLEELYRGCEIARKLGDALRIGRIIARPYLGRPGSFKRTEKRRDYSIPPPEATILDRLQEDGIGVTAVGKLEDIFSRRGISQSFHTGCNADSQATLLELLGRKTGGLIFVNFIDFDMLYGHRRDASGYARALEQTDAFLLKMTSLLEQDDLLIITADHGNDPTFKGSDHTREYAPILVFQPGSAGRMLGIRQGFFDIAQSLAAWFGIPPMPRGTSFLRR